MKLSGKSYPHPVLGNEDDLAGEFRVDFKYELSKDFITLLCHFDIRNKTIQGLINTKKASFVVELECNRTFYRATFSSRKADNSFEIPSQFCRERVDVSFFICADENIFNYSPQECHKDYKGIKFFIESGDVLAFGGTSFFIAEKDFDPLKPPVRALMAIKEGTHHEGPAQVDYESDKIIILLSKSDFKAYSDISKKVLSIGIIHSAIVLPVLISAINFIYEEAEEFSDKSWFARLESVLTEKGLKEKDAFEAAQKILESPMSRGLSNLRSIYDESDND